MGEGEVSTAIDAPPAAGWELVGDPTRMGEWSPECERVEWASDVAAPAVGARFKGHNRLGRRRWTTAGTVASYEPGRDISWDVAVAGRPVSRWGYRIEPSADGSSCTLVERFVDRRG